MELKTHHEESKSEQIVSSNEKNLDRLIEKIRKFQNQSIIPNLMNQYIRKQSSKPKTKVRMPGKSESMNKIDYQTSLNTNNVNISSQKNTMKIDVQQRKIGMPTQKTSMETQFGQHSTQTQNSRVESASSNHNTMKVNIQQQKIGMPTLQLPQEKIRISGTSEIQSTNKIQQIPNLMDQYTRKQTFKSQNKVNMPSMSEVQSTNKIDYQTSVNTNNVESSSSNHNTMKVNIQQQKIGMPTLQIQEEKIRMPTQKTSMETQFGQHSTQTQNSRVESASSNQNTLSETLRIPSNLIKPVECKQIALEIDHKKIHEITIFNMIDEVKCGEYPIYRNKNIYLFRTVFGSWCQQEITENFNPSVGK